MKGRDTADVVVIGLGAVGAATLLGLARRGVQAVGLDRFDPPHAFGSSHGESRITRLAVGEGAAYAPLVARSHALWRQLEEETGERLMLLNGGLVMSRPGARSLIHNAAGFVAATASVATAFGIAHEMLDGAEVARRFPAFLTRGDEVAYYEPTAGMLFPERCVAATLSVARRLGAVVRTDEAVLGIRQSGAAVTVDTSRGTISANRVVAAAGPWTAGLIGGALAERAVPYRQTLHWFMPQEPSLYAPARFPVFIWLHGDGAEDSFYGFPIAPGGDAVKVATEHYETPASPDRVDRAGPDADSEEMALRHVAGRLRGLGLPAARSQSCMYSVTPDFGFIVAPAPQGDRVLLVSACSGHGFKHSAALGEAVAGQIASGVPDPLLAPFAMRPALAG